MSSTDNCDDLHFEEHVVRLLLSALNSPELPPLRNTLQLPDAEPVIGKLVAAGCARNMLMDSLAFAQRLPELYESTPATVFGKIADAIAELERGLKLFPNVLLPFLTAEHGGAALIMQPISGDCRLSEETLRELKQLRHAAIHLQESIQRTGVPLRRQIGRVAWLWPAFYVQYATGTTRYPEVGELLGYTTLGAKNPDQLSKAAKQVREQSPAVIPWLLMSLGRLPSESAVQPGAPGQLEKTYWVESPD